jgi:hypothetical protein
MRHSALSTPSSSAVQFQDDMDGFMAAGAVARIPELLGGTHDQRIVGATLLQELPRCVFTDLICTPGLTGPDHC